MWSHRRLLLCSAGSVSEDGRVWMWGDNRFCQLGIPASRQTSEPSQVHTHAGGWIADNTYYYYYITYI